MRTSFFCELDDMDKSGEKTNEGNFSKDYRKKNADKIKKDFAINKIT